MFLDYQKACSTFIRTLWTRGYGLPKLLKYKPQTWHNYTKQLGERRSAIFADTDKALQIILDGAGFQTHGHKVGWSCHSHHPARSHLLACSAVHLERLYCAKYGSLWLSPLHTSTVFRLRHYRIHQGQSSHIFQGSPDAVYCLQMVVS